MTPNFANSASVMAREAMIVRGGKWSKVTLKVRYGVVQHPKHGTILIDTGYTHETTSAAGRSLILRTYAKVLKPMLNELHQPDRVLASRGQTVDDVAYVVVTHFHADHVSGLKQFPNARFIGCGDAYGRLRSNGQRQNLRHGVFDELLPKDFATRFVALNTLPATQRDILGLKAAIDLFGDGSILAVDLPGHADGHFGLLFEHAGTPVLYAVDTQWHLSALDGKEPRLLPNLIAHNRNQMSRSTARIADFQHRGGHVVLCHDPADTAYDLVQ